MPSNRERLKLVAEGLDDLRTRVVFVGGCVAQLYATDPASAEVRPSDDVDRVVDRLLLPSLQDAAGIVNAPCLKLAFIFA